MSGCWFVLELDSTWGLPPDHPYLVWTVPLMPDAEAILGDYLRDHPALASFDARVAGRTPDSQTLPWVKVTLLDAADDRVSNIEHLIDYLVQFDCYAGKDAADNFVAQSEASNLTRTVRVALKALQGQTIDGVVISSVRFTGMVRLPDADGFEPARERYVLTASVVAHA